MFNGYPQFGDLGLTNSNPEGAINVTLKGENDYLYAGARVQLWLSVSRLNASNILALLALSPVGGIITTTLRVRAAERIRDVAKQVLSSAREFKNVTVNYTSGAGAVVINYTTALDFEREIHAVQRALQLLEQNGVSQLEYKHEFLSRVKAVTNPNGKTSTTVVTAPPIRNTINPDAQGGGLSSNGQAPSPLDYFANGLGLSTPLVIALAVGLGLLVFKK